MYDNQIFFTGVHSVLLVVWDLNCETPLAVRNGVAVAYSDSALSKTRGEDLHLSWTRPDDQNHEVSTLCYGYEIKGDRVYPYHFIPASSVRGSLRSWTMRHLVHPDFLNDLTPPLRDDETSTDAYVRNICQALDKRSNGYELIASLFGLAANTKADKSLPANAGRLWIETGRFEAGNLRTVDASGTAMTSAGGPTNARRHLAVRNPLDRVTHSSRQGGLHHFLEFSRGSRFTTRLSILNPQDSDIGLVRLWARELELGLLRFGALSSIGRGRVSIRSQTYHLWRWHNAPLLKGFSHFEPNTDREGPTDVLAGIWNHHSLPLEALGEFDIYLKEYV